MAPAKRNADHAPNNAAGKKQAMNNPIDSRTSNMSTIVNTGTAGILQNPVCVVVYCNGSTSYFESGVDDARIKHSNMGIGVVQEYKAFETETEAKEFIATSVPKITTTEKEKVSPLMAVGNHNQAASLASIVSPEKPPPPKPKGLSALAKITFEKPGSTDLNQESNCIDGKPAAFGKPIAFDTKHRGYLDFVQKTSLTSMVKLDVRIFKYKGSPPPKYQVVAFDLINTTKSQTYWAHNAGKWAEVFSAAKHNYKEMYDEICYKFTAYPVRDINDMSDRNACKTLVVTNKKSNRTYNLQVVGLYVTLPHELTEEEVMKELYAFNNNAKKEYAMEAYMQFHEASAPSLKACITPHTGDYWKLLNSAFSVRPYISYMDSLDSTFRDDVITVLMKELFNEERHPVDYDDIERQKFAYGLLMESA